MRRRRLDMVGAIALLAIAVALPTRAVASDGVNLTGLSVGDGIVWHATNPFFVQWDPNPKGYPSVVHFAVRGPHGEVLSTGADPEIWNATKPQVPPSPGIYRFEAWNVNTGSGESGPPVSIPLYFDNERPPSVAVRAPAWVAPGTTIPVQILHPTAPPPLSGIYGYAVSID
ncbi:MAG TPA: hypothetical protein VHA80_00075, partial [Solirubrobacterales bacterium]|nr:hypothetical protein [Solirubrobacterales bacterium]